MTEGKYKNDYDRWILIGVAIFLGILLNFVLGCASTHPVSTTARAVRDLTSCVMYCDPSKQCEVPDDDGR